MKTLILFPHGLGDCILLTPTLRELYNKFGMKVDIVTLKRFESAMLFDNCPYVDKIFYSKDAWHDFEHGNVELAFNTLFNEWGKFAEENGYKQYGMPMHRGSQNKITMNADYFGLQLEDTHTEIFTTDEDKKNADKLIEEFVGDEKYGFVQTETGVVQKNLPEGYGRKWLSDNKGIKNVIEIGKEIGVFDYNINVQFEILRRASSVCIPDSVFYHACHAIGKDIDFVYFGRGEGVYNRVKPLHKVNENVRYSL
tara:strand:+ start:32 stop:790 length:759 start_codon:yes stop_codon:yes gene_type:complete